MRKKVIRAPKIIGRTEKVKFILLDNYLLDAKIDTGAYTSALHCFNIHESNLDGKNKICFSLSPDVKDKQYFCFEDFKKKMIKSSSGEAEERYIIKTKIEIAGKKIISTISLTDRGTMRYPVLIGRKLLKGKFLVDVSKSYTGGIELKN